MSNWMSAVLPFALLSAPALASSNSKIVKDAWVQLWPVRSDETGRRDSWRESPEIAYWRVF